MHRHDVNTQMTTIQAPTTEHDGRKYRMLFVRGRMRSGTNWIGRLLNLHPQVNCQGEFHFEKLHAGFENFIDGAKNGIGHDVAAAASHCYQHAVKLCMAERASYKPKATWVADRTAAPLEDWFPGVPVIHTMRDGRDAVVSWLMHTALRGVSSYGNEGCEAWLGAFAADRQLFEREPQKLVAHEGLVRHAAMRWNKQVRADRAFIARINSGELDTPFFGLQYEDLHRDTEGVRRGMYEFLGLDPDEAMPLSSETGTLPGTPAGNGIGKGVVGTWESYFTQEAKRWFNDEAGELLVELGYTQDMNW